MAIDTSEPLSDGWWMKRLYDQLRDQQKRCDALQKRYEGNGPVPFVSDIQRDAVKWFVEKSRSAFERVIVNAVLSRLRIRGVRTAVDDDEGGDEEAFTRWLAARGKLFTRDVHKHALAMGLGYLIVGKDKQGSLLVTAEDPRLVTAITDPENPYRVLAALKLFHDDVNEQDVAYLYLPGRVRVAKKPRKRRGLSDPIFNPAAYDWDEQIVDDAGSLISEGASGTLDWLVLSRDTDGNIADGIVPVVPFVNEDGMAEFEPFLNQIDRINQQILQRMTIATVQAFKQRVIKGVPRKDPDTGQTINYDEILTADPGAVWLLPETAEIWESGQVDLTPILAAIRDDVKDLYATSGTPAYLASPDAANSAAESASLQREQTVFKVEDRQDRFEPAHQLTMELIFRTLGDDQRAEAGKVGIIWAPVERSSFTERSNAIAQTKGVIPIYQQLTEIWGMDPDQATRAQTLLRQDMVLAQQFAAAAQTQQSGGTGGAAAG